MSQRRGFWSALEGTPGLAGVDVEWKMQMGKDHDFGRGFLRPNGRLATSYPCLEATPCDCCGHTVIVYDPDRIVAACQCEIYCKTYTLTRSDLIVYEADLPRLDGAIREVLGFVGESEAFEGHKWTRRIGIYEPYAGLRFPVYWAICLEHRDFEAVVRGQSLDYPDLLGLDRLSQGLAPKSTIRRGTGTTAARDLAIPNPGLGDEWFNTELPNGGAWQKHTGTDWK